MDSDFDAAWPFGLNPRELDVLTLRLDHTLEEVGREYVLSRERIRQIESKAHKRLLLRVGSELPDVLLAIRELLKTSTAADIDAIAAAIGRLSRCASQFSCALWE